MRFKGMEKLDGDWLEYSYEVTYPMGWHNCVFNALTLAPHLKDAEVLVAGGIGTPFKTVEIKDRRDFLSLEEGGALEIRGRNTIYDNVPFQFRFFNQTPVVRLLVPARYIDELEKKAGDEKVPLTEEEKKTIFDKFMDSIELDGFINFTEFSTTRKVANQVAECMVNPAGNAHAYYTYTSKVFDGKDIPILNFDKVFASVGGNGQNGKTGATEAVANALNALNKKSEAET